MEHQNRKPVTELVIQGLVVRLIFSEQANTTVPERVRELLKAAYLDKSVS